jgi:hypothetical protein
MMTQLLKSRTCIIQVDKTTGVVMVADGEQKFRQIAVGLHHEINEIIHLQDQQNQQNQLAEKQLCSGKDKREAYYIGQYQPYPDDYSYRKPFINHIY